MNWTVSFKKSWNLSVALNEIDRAQLVAHIKKIMDVIRAARHTRDFPGSEFPFHKCLSQIRFFDSLHEYSNALNRFTDLFEKCDNMKSTRSSRSPVNCRWNRDSFNNSLKSNILKLSHSFQFLSAPVPRWRRKRRRRRKVKGRFPV
jgi:hypothetical protein